MFSSTLERRRSFHQLGIIVAVTLFVAGLVLLAALTIRGLDMFHVVEADRAPIIAGMFIGLAALGLLCLIAYYTVRVIGWFISR